MGGSTRGVQVVLWVDNVVLEQQEEKTWQRQRTKEVLRKFPICWSN